jgi:Ca2+-binding RTX toxin-like protein
MDRRLRIATLAAALTLVSATATVAETPPFTDGPDVIETGNGPDRIRGGPGLDRIFAAGGADVIRGGPDGDEIGGGNGRDTHYGNAGPDDLSEYDVPTEDEPDRAVRGIDEPDGFTGNDVMHGGKGPDFIEGAQGNDTIYGDDGPDNGCGGAEVCANLYGDTGDDTIYGGQGDDGMEGEQGSDSLYGGEGSDWLDAADEETVGDSDFVDCGPGYDYALVNEDDTVVNCEEVETVPPPTEDPDAATVAQEHASQERARLRFRAHHGIK